MSVLSGSSPMSIIRSVVRLNPQPYTICDMDGGMLGLAGNRPAAITNARLADLGLDAVTEVDVKQFTFPGGERHVAVGPTFTQYRFRDPVQRGTSTTSTMIVIARVPPSDPMPLLLLTDAIRRANVTDIHLVLPYMPYARQDRVMVPGEPLSVKVFANLLNSQEYKSVIVLDPHSDVTGAVVNHMKSVNNLWLIKQSLAKAGFDKDEAGMMLVAPDAGAAKKLSSLLVAASWSPKVVECSKTRNLADGRITGIKVNAESADIKGQHMFIVDDIIDGGATFQGIATELKAKGAATVSLIVSHCIMSKGIEPEALDRVFTTNSLPTAKAYTKTTVFDCLPQMLAHL